MAAAAGNPGDILGGRWLHPVHPSAPGTRTVRNYRRNGPLHSLRNCDRRRTLVADQVVAHLHAASELPKTAAFDSRIYHSVVTQMPLTSTSRVSQVENQAYLLLMSLTSLRRKFVERHTLM